MAKPKFVGLNGLKGVGRFEFLTLIKVLIASNHHGKIVAEKIKNIIRWHLTRPTKAGQLLRKIGDEQINCRDLPQDLFLLICESWMEMNGLDEPNTILLLSGFPGNYGQLAFMDHFEAAKVIFIEPSQDHVEMVMEKKEKAWKEKWEKAWDEYEYSIKPAITALNGNVVHLRQEQPLRERLQEVAPHLDGIIDPHLVKVFSRRIRDHAHPIHNRIRHSTHSVRDSVRIRCDHL